MKHLPILFAAAVLVGLLAACGGGGGGNEPSAPAGASAEGSLSVSTATCDVQENLSTCDVVLTAVTKNTSSAVIVDDSGKSYPVTPNTSASLTMSIAAGASKTFELSYGGTTTAKVAVSAKCAASTYPDSASDPTCRRVLRYSSVVYGLANTPLSPVRFMGDSCRTLTVGTAKNETRFKLGYDPLGNEWIYKTPLPSGRIMFAAENWEAGGQRNAFVLNPLTNTIEDYEGSEGPAPDMTNTYTQGPDPGWVDVSASHEEDPIGGFAETDTYMIFVTRTDNRIVYCRDKQTGVDTRIDLYDPDLQYKAFVPYKH